MRNTQDFPPDPIPLFGKETVFLFPSERHKGMLAQDKLEILRYSAPMSAGVLPLVILGHGIWMNCRVHITSVLVK